jgi:hypothetical protein
MAKLFDHWDDLDEGDFIEVTCHSGAVRSGTLGGFYRRKADVGFEYWCDILTDRGWLMIPTQLIFGINRTVSQHTEPESFGEVLDDE